MSHVYLVPIPMCALAGSGFVEPAKEVKPPKVKPQPKDPYIDDEVMQILAACDQLGNGPYERDTHGR